MYQDNIYKLKPDTIDSLYQNALKAMESVLNLVPGDNVLILTDKFSAKAADAFYNSARDKGCRVDKYVIDDGVRPINNIPPGLLNLLYGKTIVLNIMKAIPQEINFRIKWLFTIEEIGSIRCAHMPGMTEEILRSGAMEVDYHKMQTDAKSLVKIFKNADILYITTEDGTDLILGVKNRRFMNDVHILAGQTCNLPCGEIYCAPEEKKAKGTLVVNASIGDIGLLNEPLKIEIENGKIISYESKDENLIKTITSLTEIDEDAKIIGELGIGINPGAAITGNMLEDEKALGTAHIAFGNNEDFPGGKNKSKIHRDYLFYKPNIKAFYSDGKSKWVMNDGKFTV